MQPYVGEIILVAFNFAPPGWLTCDGQLLPISEYETLFQLIGTTYGGDGESTFALPDLRGRVPVGMGQGSGLQNYSIGETFGVESVTLNTNQIPIHTHGFNADSLSAPLRGRTSPATQRSPVGNSFAAEAAGTTHMFTAQAPNALMRAGSAAVNVQGIKMGAAGASQPHDNLQPSLAMHYIISVFGIFPSPA